MKDGSDEKMMPFFWLPWLHAPGLVSRPKQTKNFEWKLNFYFNNNDMDLDYRHLCSNRKLRLDVSYPYSKFGFNRPKQTKVIERKLNFYF